MKTKKSRPKFQVGDRVRMYYGLQDVFGTIVEDMGCIGVGGRRLFHVKVDFGETTFFTQAPEEELTAVE
jgi:hypothetical protein